MSEETLFHEALARPPAERAAFLDAACAGQSELRAAVEALLAAHAASASLLDRPAADPNLTGDYTPPPGGATGVHVPTEPQPGYVIAGRYTLEQKIGEGGMGEVWVAKQTEPVKRRVALKLIKAGMDSKAVLQRFEAERQALALMDHPHIAKVLDGGLTQDRHPFFVMELVNGLPLHKFCDEAKLTPKERLELFVPICQAVQHAHQKGIIHRDLKPSNILVTLIDGKPVPKVIDFGVAKATAGKLTDESLSTNFGAVVGTLEYMAPEQAGYSGEDIDTRADIYSLGVILYEMLTGLRPLDSKRLRQAALSEMIRMIKEEEPSKPSTRLSTDESLPSLAALRRTEPRKLMALLRGELDWVVMKCLEKQRDRRYETANGLARDIQRYLADEPVEARPPSFSYRAGKFLRRHRGTVFAAVLIFLTLVGGIIGTALGLVQARAAQRDAVDQQGIAEKNETEAKKQANLAREKLAQAQAIAEFLLQDILGQAGSAAEAQRRYPPNPNLTIREALDRASETVGTRFHDHQDLEAYIRHTLGMAYDQVAEYPKAIAHLRRAKEIFLQSEGETGPSHLVVMNQLGVALQKAGDHAESIPLFERACDISRQHNGESHRDTLTAKNNLALAYRYSGRMAEAIRLHEEIRVQEEKLFGPESADLLITMNNLAQCYLAVNQAVKACELLEKACKGMAKVLPADHPDTLTALHNLAHAYSRTGKLPQALQLFETVLAKRIKRLGPDHADTWKCKNSLAITYNQAKRHAEAIALFEEVRQGVLAKKLTMDDPQMDVAYQMLGVAYFDAKQFAKAVTLYEELLAHRRAKLGDRDVKTLEAAFNLGLNLMEAGRLAEAVRHLSEWLPRAEKLLPENHYLLPYARNVTEATYTKAKRNDLLIPFQQQKAAMLRQQKDLDPRHLAMVLMKLGIAHLELKQYAAAEPVWREVCAILTAKEPEVWTTFHLTSLLGASLLGQKKYTDAEPLLLKSYEGMKQREKMIPAQGKIRLTEALERLVRLYEAMDKKDEAVKWRKELEATKAAQVKPETKP